MFYPYKNQLITKINCGFLYQRVWLRTHFAERDLKGICLDKATNIDNAHLTGIHLALPGYEDNLPTLEIFKYDNNKENLKRIANRKGFGHNEVKVDHIEEILNKLLEAGGTQLGKMVGTEITNAGHLTFVIRQRYRRKYY